MRSRPAKASLSCVPIDASWMTGIVIIAVKAKYWKKSPIVICPARIALPPISIIAMPIAAMTSDEKAVIDETPVSDCATLRNSRCAPCAKTISSRFSAV